MPWERVTGDAMLGDVLERVLEGGITIDIVDSIDDDDDDGSEGSSGAPAILAFAPKPRHRKPSGPGHTHRKAG